MVGNSNDNTNFPHKLLLTDRQVANIRKAFSNNLSTDVKFSIIKNSIIKNGAIRRIFRKFIK